MDLSSISTKKKANEGAFLHLKDPRDPTGETYLYDGAVEVGLFVMGKDSDLFQATRNKNLNDHLLNQRKKSPETIEQIKAKTDEMLAKMTTGWQGLEYNGSADFSRETILQVYSDSGWDWLRQQVSEFIDKDANFI